MKNTVSAERRIDSLGVGARAFAIVRAQDGRILSQIIKATREHTDNGDACRMTATLRFDDCCNNGHEDFAATCSRYRMERGRWVEDGGGADHAGIAAVFPEWAPLLKWHLCGVAGPMHYPGNPIFLAGDRDCWGRRAGEPASFTDAILFRGVPLTHKIGARMADFCRHISDHGWTREGQAAAMIPIAVPYSGSSSHDFAPKWQFAGQPPLAWHECEFDTEARALAFADSFLNHEPEILRIPTSYSQGKAREFDLARGSAVWPEATDAELSQEPDALKAALLARLPALLDAFRADMIAAGFEYPEPRAR